MLDRSAIVPYSDPPSEASPGAPPLPPSMTPTSGAPQVPPRYRRSESKVDFYFLSFIKYLLRGSVKKIIAFLADISAKAHTPPP